MTMRMSAIRPTPIMRVWDMWRVPFGLMPVTPATTATTTARLNQTSQFMTRVRYKMRANGEAAISYQL